MEESENGKFLGRPKRFENRHVMFEKEDPDGDITAVKFKADSTSTGCWDLGDPEPSQPSALRRARKMTVTTDIVGQVKAITTVLEQPCSIADTFKDEARLVFIRDTSRVEEFGRFEGQLDDWTLRNFNVSTRETT